MKVGKFHLKTETESSLRNVMFQITDRTMDNVQKYDTTQLNFKTISWSKTMTALSVVSVADNGSAGREGEPVHENPNGTAAATGSATHNET
jgi:hypothetical protein